MYLAYRFKQTNLKKFRELDIWFSVFPHTSLCEYFLTYHCHVVQLKSKAFRISQDIEILLVEFSFVTVIPPSLPHLPSLLHHNTYIHGSRLICLTIKMQFHVNQICSAKPTIYTR